MIPGGIAACTTFEHIPPGANDAEVHVPQIPVPVTVPPSQVELPQGVFVPQEQLVLVPSMSLPGQTRNLEAVLSHLTHFVPP
ncbi:MAG TPA: hypothetical protein VND64_35545 [Pirellulales bacterium]|nr:hypothetical protein [Pirellulales bacterium]